MSSKESIEEIKAQVRAEIRATHPKKFNFSRRELAELISISEGHIANLESDEDKQPLIEPRPQGKRGVVYHVTDIVDYLVNQRLRRREKRRGPRTKIEIIEGENK